MPEQTEIIGEQTLQIECAAELEWAPIEAADGAEKIPSFKMVAYRGGPMQLAGFFRPVVIDLAGMKRANRQLPVFRSHDHDRILGHGTAEITATEITASGLISAENEDSRDVVASSRRGFPWQASVGGVGIEFESLKEGDKATVNGKIVKGPVVIARKSVLGEISIVPMGADSSSRTTIAARRQALISATVARPPEKPTRITISAAGNGSGLWIEGGGIRFVPREELETLLEKLPRN